MRGTAIRCGRKRMNDFENWSREKLVERLKYLEARLGEKAVDGSRLETGRPFDFSKHTFKRMAFKFAYVGWPFNGLVLQEQPTPMPTVESKIFQALHTTKLIESVETCNFSRCGRTDKGVSAFGQVMSFNACSVREDQEAVPYLRHLNRILPQEIRVLAQAEVDESFSARFSCKRRHYRYFFMPHGLDIYRMQEAAAYFVGEHDFRNFCKIDPSKQINNYRREMYVSQIFHGSDGLCYFDLQGSAFLWHQVRCMMAVLFLVGQAHEDPSTIKEMLNTDLFFSKPMYDIASELPLVLWDCQYGDEVKWDYGSNDERQILVKSLYEYWHSLRIKENMSRCLLSDIAGVREDEINHVIAPKAGFESVSRVVDGSGRYRAFRKYTPMKNRKRMEDFATLNERWRQKRESGEEAELIEDSG